MREEILKRFFQGTASATELTEDIAGSTRLLSPRVSRTEIEDMADEFQVTRPMLIGLCDAVLGGELAPKALNTIGFALLASDRFFWDGDADDVLASIISDWSCPEVNYALTTENIRRFRKWLLGLETYPVKPPLKQTANYQVISRREKISKRHNKMDEEPR